MSLNPEENSGSTPDFSESRGVNGTFLAVYPTRIVFDKAGVDKIFFSLAYWVWVWVRIFFR